MKGASIIAACSVLLAATLVSAPARAQAPTDPGIAHAHAVERAKSAMMTDPVIALREARAAVELARRVPTGDPLRFVTARWLEAEALNRVGRAAEAEPILLQTLTQVPKLAPNTELHGRLLVALGDARHDLGQVVEALQSYHAGHDVFVRAKDNRGQAISLQNIGSIYEEAGDFARAERYYAQSTDVYRDDPVLLLTAYNNTAVALREQGKLPEAVDALEKALALAQSMESPYLEASVLGNLASVEVAANALSDAERHVRQGLRTARREPAGQELVPYLWGVMGLAEAKRGQLRAAADHLERAFTGQNLATTDSSFRDFHAAAWDVHSRLGDSARALTHLAALRRLENQAHTATASASAALAAARFDFASQQSRIASLKAGQLARDVKLAEARGTTTRLVLGGSAVLLVLLTLGLAGMRRSRERIRKANVELAKAHDDLSRALRARTEFLATTSHEVRTPLNGILGMAQVLIRDRSLPSDAREKIGIIQGAGETMLALVDDILDVAKIETGNLVIQSEPVDLAKLIADAAQMWRTNASARGLAFELRAETAPRRILSDATRLRQIVFNLVSNAVKFTEAGAVTLEVAVEGDTTLLLRVRDTGVGVPADKLEEIFESFRQADSSITRRYGGTGLGLAICRRLAMAMGGDISVQSVLGEGSTFTVRLPLRTLAADTEDAAQPGDGFAILVVEANPLRQGLLRTILRPCARAVETVGSVEEARDAAQVTAFDVILADCAALGPDPQSCAAAVELLARALPSSRVVVMWGNGSDHAPLLQAAGAEVVLKPVTPANLLARLQDGARAEAGAAARAS